MAFINGLLNNLEMPGGAPTLASYITPPDPNVEADVPTAYVWPMPGSEKRLTEPRNTGPGTPAGWKTTRHEIGIYLVWFGSDEDPDADALFPGYLDALMDALRTAWPMPAVLTDPWTGEQTQLVDAGEEMSYDSPPPRATEDQRYLRYDALIRVPVTEAIRRLRGRAAGRLGDHGRGERALGDQERPLGRLIRRTRHVRRAVQRPADHDVSRSHSGHRLRVRPGWVLGRLQLVRQERDRVEQLAARVALGQLADRRGVLLVRGLQLGFVPDRPPQPGQRALRAVVPDCSDRGLREHLVEGVRQLAGQPGEHFGDCRGDRVGQPVGLAGRRRGHPAHRRPAGRNGGGAIAAVPARVAAAVLAARVIGSHAP
jgi:hypothetical protein